MTRHSAAAAETSDPVGSRFMTRVFYVFASLAVLSVAISVGGRWLGGSIASVGHTDDTRMLEVVIVNNVLNVPANHVRFEKQRIDGEARRLDLYMRWPDLGGYSNDVRDDFNHRDGSRRIIFLSLEPRMMSRDMSERFEPIYRRLVELPGAPGPAALKLYHFGESSGYTNETLLVGERPGKPPFVARCLAESAAEESLAPCERDVHFGDGLSMIYRFPAGLLGEWRELDAAVIDKMKEFLRTAP